MVRMTENEVQERLSKYHPLYLRGKTTPLNDRIPKKPIRNIGEWNGIPKIGPVGELKMVEITREDVDDAIRLGVTSNHPGVYDLCNEKEGFPR